MARKQASEVDDADDSGSVGGDELVNRVEAMRILGLSPTAFQRRVRDGVITGTLVKGQKMYDRAELEASRLESDASSTSRVLGQLLQLSRDMLKDSRTHNLELMKLVKDPASVFVEGIKSEVASLRTANEESKKTWLEARKLVEELTTDKHQRELEKQAAEKSEQRKDEAFELFKELAPELVDQVFGVKTIKSFVRKLTPAQLAFLSDESEGAMLTPEQRETFKIIFEKFSEKVKGNEAQNGQAKEAVDAGKPAQSGSSSNGVG